MIEREREREREREKWISSIQLNFPLQQYKIIITITNIKNVSSKTSSWPSHHNHNHYNVYLTSSSNEFIHTRFQTSRYTFGVIIIDHHQHHHYHNSRKTYFLQTKQNKTATVRTISPLSSEDSDGCSSIRHYCLLLFFAVIGI